MLSIREQSISKQVLDHKVDARGPSDLMDCEISSERDKSVGVLLTFGSRGIA